MQFLPLLAVESIAWRLPVSDRSAIILARAMLDGDGPAVVAALADTLSSDPPLTLWSLCRAAQSGIAPRAAKNLAEWLAARVVELLASRNLSTDAAPADGSLVDRYASLVEQAVLRADWAVALASDDPSVPAEEIHLAALVHGPWAWHEAAVGDSSAGGSLPPTNLLPEIPPPIAQRLAESLARLQTAQSTGSEDERLT
ncbi:MAG TPA: hypothetical protein VJL29_11945, partial [Thermoguttaceae bacterium]|nr:hypothetical protein [Thermoguttaceae bacterium]